jgi:serine/threonine-protein kinase
MLMSGAKEQDNKRSEGKADNPNKPINGSTPGPGSQIGHFCIEQELGRGGGGVVYLARDTKLDRSVAIKSLPPEVVDNPEILSSFTREARVLASLNHPNIATIYDEIEDSEGTSYIVLEYVPGQTLAERITKGPLKIEEALTIALQITEAVAVAHEHNVIHRDIKPSNIKITPDDKVKVLDFGLAKAIGGEVTDQQSTVTVPGRVIGTPAYMSPEQARGKPIDNRTDIWSFGCVLYEMLTAKIPFEGETISDTLANVLQADPDLQALPQNTPANIRSLLRRCLEKDPRRRLQHIGDAGIEIHETLNVPAIAPPIGAPSVAPPRSARWKIVALCMFVGLVVGAIAMHVGLRDWIQTTEPMPVRRYSITLHPEDPLWPDLLRNTVGKPTFTPDGRQLIYVAGTAGDTWLVARYWDNIEAERIRGTEGAQWPEVSPDGRWLTFTTQDVIWKVPLAGGTPERITDNPYDLPFVWEDNNTLILSTQSLGTDGLSRFDLRTLETEPLTTLDATPGKFVHAPIQFDPESGTLFFIAARGYGIEGYSICALAMESRRVKPLVERAVSWYAPSGHLVYAQKGRFMAAPFDTKTLEITGPAIDMMEKRMVTGKTIPSFIFSRDGTLVYSPAGGYQKPNRELVWVDFEGQEEPVGTDPMRYERVCASCDRAHSKVAVELFDDPSIWIYDLTGTNPIQPLIFSSRDDYVYPVWMPPDNREIIFASRGSGSPQLYRKAADGSGEAEALLIDTSGLTFLSPHGCTPDGNVLLATAGSEENPALDLLAIHLEHDGRIEPLLLSDVRDSHPALSKDGKWLAYVCLESTGAKIFVTSYPNLEGKWLVSTEYGHEPVWAPDGKAIYYRDGTSVIAVPVETEGGFSLGRAQTLFEDVYVTDNFCRTYDIHPDGKRFLMMKRIEEDVPLTEIIVVENWFEELKRRVPTGKN